MSETASLSEASQPVSVAPDAAPSAPVAGAGPAQPIQAASEGESDDEELLPDVGTVREGVASIGEASAESCRNLREDVKSNLATSLINQSVGPGAVAGVMVDCDGLRFDRPYEARVIERVVEANVSRDTLNRATRRTIVLRGPAVCPWCGRKQSTMSCDCGGVSGTVTPLRSHRWWTNSSTRRSPPRPGQCSR